MATVAFADEKPATPEEIWAILRETARRQEEIDRQREESDRKWKEQQAESEKKWKEQQAEAERKWKEQVEEDRQKWAELRAMMAETDRKSAETDRQLAETAKLVKKTCKEMGGLGNTFGDVIEHLFAPGTRRLFRELGHQFDRVPLHGKKIREGGKLLAEIDLLMENEETVAAVEVKARVRVKDVTGHADRLETLRGWLDRRGDRRELIGAMAGAAFGEEERKAALEAGFYVMAQSGDTVLLDVPEGFQPRKW